MPTLTPRFCFTLLLLCAWLLLPLAPAPVQAASVPAGAAPSGGQVGDGTQVSCTDDALNAKLAGGGTVTFSCGGPLSIFLNSTKTITQNTTIDGSGGITLDGIDSFSIFIITPSVTSLTLKNITLNQGFGGSTDGGAIKNHGTLRLDHTVIQSSRTDSNHSGGAIFTDGPLFISDSLLQNNQGGSAGAIFANFALAQVAISDTTFLRNQAIDSTPTTGYGGAIWVGELAQVSIVGGAIRSNTAEFGGGLYLSPNATVMVASAGAPASLSGNMARSAGGGVFNAGGRVTLNHVTLNGNSAAVMGGGVGNQSGHVSLTNATLSGNSAGSGGGLSNDQAGAALTLTHVSLIGNQALFGGGGLYNNYGTATLANVVVSGNVVTNTYGVATYGGGIKNFGLLTVTKSTFTGNVATNSPSLLGFGGGIYNNHYTSQDTLTVSDSTFSGNSARNGGGLLNTGTLTLTNTTLSSNSAASVGGGLENYQAKASLTNATFSGNSAPTGGALFQQGQAPTQTLTVRNTIVASGSSGANCELGLDSFGSLVSQGYNLSNEGTCAPYFTQTSDANNQSPNLGPLANHGGPTFTQLPAAPSPAIDAIANGANGCGTTLTTDQRGAPRPLNGQCDIGAVEIGWLYPQLWLPLTRR